MDLIKYMTALDLWGEKNRETFSFLAASCKTIREQTVLTEISVSPSLSLSFFFLTLKTVQPRVLHTWISKPYVVCIYWHFNLLHWDKMLTATIMTVPSTWWNSWHWCKFKDCRHWCKFRNNCCRHHNYGLA